MRATRPEWRQPDRRPGLFPARAGRSPGPGGGAKQLPACAAQRLGGSQEPVNPLHRVDGTRGEGRRGTGGRGQHDQGRGEQAGIAGSRRRIVGVQFHQPRHLLLGVSHQGQEREHLAADPGQGQQPVMAAGQVGSLVRQDRIQLAGIERLYRRGGQDHRGLPSGHAVGSRLGMLHQHGPQGRLGAPDQPRGLRVAQRLPPGGAQVGRRGERGASRHGARQGQAQPGNGGTARCAVGGAKPQHASPDQVTQPPA